MRCWPGTPDRQGATSPEDRPVSTRASETSRQRLLDDITRLIARHRVLDDLAHRQDTGRREVIEDLQRRQNVVDLQRHVRDLHPADLAYVLESLPRDSRRLIWDDLAVAQAADVLLELDVTVRDALIDATPSRTLVEIARHMDVDDLAWLADALPRVVLHEVVVDLDDAHRVLLRQSSGYEAGSIGHLMSHDVAAVRASETTADVIAELRQRGALPPHSDPLFVVDRRNVLRGALGLQALLLAAPDTPVADIMDADVVSFGAEQPAHTAAKAFERYNLVSAPVVTDRGKLIGRLTIDAVVDFIQHEADRDALAMAGLRGSEDLFASVWDSARNRLPWLFVNLVTAFLATRVIGFFESTIGELVALASLMPIVASVGGNTGNQTVALVIRGLAFDQISESNIGRVFRKELLIGLINGLLWGGLVGLAAVLLYRQVWLGIVLTLAVLWNLVVAAVVGVGIPMMLHRRGRDPAQGASVLLTFVTDFMGFLLFLGLARWLL